VSTALIGPVLGAAVLAALAARRWRRERLRDRDAEASVVDQLPEVIDLLALALGAGLSVTESMAVVGRWAPGPVGDALADAHLSILHGAPAGDALGAARDRCGSAAVALFDALVAADRYGTALGPSLDRLGHEARLDRRRAAEERARKVPVQLLFPLVVCVLPAFGLLTVVPLLVNSLGALG
jgi:tight adherence protein C